MDTLLALAGRTHLLLLHLPIGMLLLAVFMELYRRWQGTPDSSAVKFALGTSTVVAVPTIIAGILLGRSGAYNSDLLLWHRWLGIAAALLMGLAWWQYGKKTGPGFLLAALLVLTAAGHKGGSLTHGEQYLWEDNVEMPDSQMASVADTQKTVYEGWIQPVLTAKCVSCHREGKAKGDLLLDSASGLLKGGKNGPAIIPGNPGESLLLQRLLLDSGDKKHMPPAGKPQPEDREIRLLQWWIAQGASTVVKIGHDTLPADVQMWLKETRSVNPVFRLQVAMPSESALSALRKAGVHIERLSAEEPWLSASLVSSKKTASEAMEGLRKISDQLVKLDLSGSDVRDDNAGFLRLLPHLTDLNLSRTGISGKALPEASDVPFLEVLNLSNTFAGDESIRLIEKYPALKSIYLWQSRVSEQGIDQLRQAKPDLNIIGGAPLDTAAMLTLKPPRITFSRTFFKDTVHVNLDFPLQAIGVYYTIDQASPTTQSSKYTGPLILDKTTTVKAIAAKEGWAASNVAEATFIKKSGNSAIARLLTPPNEKYPAKGATSLTDGKIATEQGADTWLGFQGGNLEAVFELDRPMELHGVYVHCLENNAPWIFKPSALEAWVSVDGKKYEPAGNQTFPPNPTMGTQEVHLLHLATHSSQTARYVKVRVKNPGKNPAWHPSAGQPCWIFIDEIILE